MHRSDRARKIHGTGGASKVAVMGLLERHGEVRTMVVPNVRRKSLRKEIDTHDESGSLRFWKDLTVMSTGRWSGLCQDRARLKS